MSIVVGDKISVVNDHDIWTIGNNLDRDVIFTVVEEDKEFNSYVNSDDLTIEIEAVKSYPNDFVKVGEIVSEQTVRSDNQVEGNWRLNIKDGIAVGMGIGVVGEQAPETIIPVERDKELGVFRPNLEDRKVGKVRVELVDKGFPNALWEIARLMTKAQEVKGYADHDWKNLPNAKESLPAAASRHRMKHNKGEFYDDEFEDFKIYHKVNEAFGVLAELELILTGKIKL